MKFSRLLTTSDKPVADQIQWETRTSHITDASGKTVFKMENVEVPSHWSQTATDILAQKYLRKAGVPNLTRSIECGADVPLWLWPKRADKNAKFGPETSAKQVFYRLAGCWTYWGWREGIFGSDTIWSESQRANFVKPGSAEKIARIFYDELFYMLAMQYGAPNSPQFFNTGLHWAYGIEGSESGQWYVDYEHLKNGGLIEDAIEQGRNSYERPQPHACFIQPVIDDLVNPGGIMDLWTREVRLFKHGSGTGTNFSSIRGKGEKLSGGGVSSGLMSFLKIGDVAAGAVQSGGTTRRAAKMVCLDLDHPEIEAFVEWKMREERKAQAMHAGSEILARDDEGEIYSASFEGEAISSVSGQNSNNSVRVTNKFLERVDFPEGPTSWPLLERTTGKIVRCVEAQNLWQKICHAAWSCADPGILFHDTINSWHTCKADGEINACNPCGEYQFLDNTACNLASLNLCRFLSGNDGTFNLRHFEHAVRLWTTVLEISVYMASFPSREIAERSYNYRTLGLGYANLGGLLMRKGLAYDSDEGRNLAAGITALMHGVAYKTSAEMGSELGPFPRWKENKESMDEVLLDHYNALLDIRIVNNSKLIEDIIGETYKVWKDWDDKGYRNAQVTLLAPTGTIALLMDCDTTGIEPDFSLVKHKSLAGGGAMRIVNQSVYSALHTLGYTSAQTTAIVKHVEATGTVEDIPSRNGEPFIEPEHLPIFDCAMPITPKGRCLSPMAHVKMVAAVQPFLSGAVSKTINLPNSATVEDVDHIYREAHRLGLKAVAIYRDGSKLTQPLNIIRDKEVEDIANKFRGAKFTTDENGKGTSEWIPRLEATSNGRSPLPMHRRGYTQKFRVDGQSLYLRTGEYEDGTLGEIFVNLSREGSTVRSLMECFAKAISIGIQYGVPLNEFIDAFTHTKFEPSGVVQGHERIKLCSSMIDLIFRDLAVHYLGRNDLAQIEPEIRTEAQREIAEKISKTELKDFNDLFFGHSVEMYQAKTESETIKSEVTKANGQRDICWECGNATLIRTGTCITCTQCGANSGCG